MKDWAKIGMCFGMAAILGAFLWVKMTYASPLVFQFHSPSFSGVGTSSHYLTIENLEKSRKQALIDKADAEQRRLDNLTSKTCVKHTL